jgi:hypothetical protein
VADIATLNGIAPAATTVTGSCAGVVDTACVIDAQTTPFGTLTIHCAAAPHTGALRGDLQVASPASFGFTTATIVNGWTYTAVANGTGSAVGYCAIDAPTSTSVATGQSTALLAGEVFQAGVTEGGQGAGLLAQLGYGAASSDPTAVSWLFTTGSYVGQVGTGNNNNQFHGTILAPAVGTYPFAWRFSLDGGLTFTYCDIAGTGSNSGLPAFDATNLGTMTVTP